MFSYAQILSGKQTRSSCNVSGNSTIEPGGGFEETNLLAFRFAIRTFIVSFSIPRLEIIALRVLLTRRTSLKSWWNRWIVLVVMDHCKVRVSEPLRKVLSPAGLFD